MALHVRSADLERRLLAPLAGLLRDAQAVLGVELDAERLGEAPSEASLESASLQSSGVGPAEGAGSRVGSIAAAEAVSALEAVTAAAVKTATEAIPRVGRVAGVQSIDSIESEELGRAPRRVSSPTVSPVFGVAVLRAAAAVTASRGEHAERRREAAPLDAAAPAAEVGAAAPAVTPTTSLAATTVASPSPAVWHQVSHHGVGDGDETAMPAISPLVSHGSVPSQAQLAESPGAAVQHGATAAVGAAEPRVRFDAHPPRPVVREQSVDDRQPPAGLASAAITAEPAATAAPPPTTAAAARLTASAPEHLARGPGASSLVHPDAPRAFSLPLRSRQRWPAENERAAAVPARAPAASSDVREAVRRLASAVEPALDEARRLTQAGLGVAADSMAERVQSASLVNNTFHITVTLRPDEAHASHDPAALADALGEVLRAAAWRHGLDV